MKLTTSLLSAFLASASAAVTCAQCPVMTAPYGFADVDGDRAILSDEFPGPPRVRFYAKRSDGWHEEQTTVVGDHYLVWYAVVAMDGDRAISGSAESDDLRGRAFVFQRVGSEWTPAGLQPAVLERSDFFGASVDISGDIAVVGAAHDSLGGGDELGRVHVFEFDGLDWPETAVLPDYGDSIDVDGDTVAIGNNHLSIGRVVIYRKVRGVWSRITELRSPAGPAEGHTFGCAVALHGNRIAIGAKYPETAPGHGLVYVFEETTSGWTRTQRLEARDGAYGDAFGTSLSWSDSMLLVGAPAWSVPGVGSAHRFDEIGGRFVETDVLRSEPSAYWFGSCVAQSRGNAVVLGNPASTFFRLGIEEATPFCGEPPNSTGFPGLLAMEGCDSLVGRTLTLHASDLPPRTLARSFLGGETAPVAFGDGYRCVGNPLFRLSAANADAAGEFRSAFDFDSSGGLELRPGSTWSFQVLYRDTRSPLAGFNLTNAVAVGITP